jgi:UDP-N-acetylmuramate dehydrogenase
VSGGGPDIARLEEIARLRGIPLERDVALAPFTTLRVGGPADRYAVAASIGELVDLLELAADASVPAFLVGKGSDIVVADAGIRGLVIRVRADALEVRGASVRAEAGASMTAMAKRCAREGLAGFDWAVSIPGSFGGAVWANAGAHEGEMADVVTEVEIFDPRDGRRRTLPASDLGFGYRDSRFKHSPEVVLAGTIQLATGDPAEITALVDEHQARRKATQPLADQNAGSVFRNPPGEHAARLIESCGLKGLERGGARVSEKHANFIVNPKGAARAADIEWLILEVKRRVLQEKGVDLIPEVRIVGEAA